MSEPFLGEIKMFAGNFAPRNYAFATGQTLPVAQNQALAQLFGKTYGGNGTTTFALPNLTGVAPMGWGQGPAVNYPAPGQAVGTTVVALTAANMAPHSHALNANFNLGDVGAPSAQASICKASAGSGIYTADTSPAPTVMAPGSILSWMPSAGPYPHNNLSPYLACNFIVALQGVTPKKP
jgi:microcystin-dependent protein